MHRKQVSIIQKKLGKEHIDVATMYHDMAGLYDERRKFKEVGTYREALRMLKKALSIRLKKFGDGHPLVADTCNKMANIYNDQGKYKEALAMHEKTLSIRLNKLS